MKMFDHWTKLRAARKALADGLLEEAVELARDPLIRDHLRARAIRLKAVKKLMARARKHRDKSNLSAAFRDVQLVLTEGDRSADAVSLEREIRDEMAVRERSGAAAREVLLDAEARAAVGDLSAARDLLQPLVDADAAVKAARAQIEQRMKDADSQIHDARAAVQRGDMAQADRALRQAEQLHARHPELEEVRRSFGTARCRERLAEIGKLLRDGRAGAAWDEAQALRAEDPSCAQDPVVEEAARAVVAEHVDRATAAFDSSSASEAAVYLERARRIDRAGVSEDLTRAERAWRRGLELLDAGELDVASVVLSEACKAVHASRAVLADKERAERLRQERNDAFDDAVEHLLRDELDLARDRIERCTERVAGDRWLGAILHGLRERDPDRIVAPEKVVRTLESGDVEAGLRLAVSVFPIASLEGESRKILEAYRRTVRSARQSLQRVEIALLSSSTSRGDLEEMEREIARAQAADRGNRSIDDARARIQCQLTVLDRIDWGKAHEARGESAEALRWYSEGLAAVPDSEVCRAAVERLGTALGQSALASAELDLDSGRWERARETTDQALALAELPDDVRQRLLAVRARIVEADSAADESVVAAREAFETGEIDAARAAVDRLMARYPGHPEATALRARIEAFDGLAPQIRAVEDALAAGRGEDARVLFDALDGAEAGHPRMVELRSRIDRESCFAERFIVRVEEGSDYLVLAKDVIRIGNIMGEGLDISIMASISTEHAEIRRTRSFHGGCKYEIEALPGKDCFVNDRRIDVETLGNGDRVRLGEDLEFVFRLPSSKSKTAMLELREGFEVDGVRQILLMLPAGREGRVVVSRGPDAHITMPGAERSVEIYRPSEGHFAGELVCHSNTGVRVDGEGGAAEERLYPGCYVECGPCRFSVEAFLG